MEHVSDWHHTLTNGGARTDDNGVVTGFGDPLAEGRAAEESVIVVPLTADGLIRVSGADGVSFLNSQLTSDVALVSPDRAQYSGYCTPKGRLLATMLLFMRDDALWLSLPDSIAADIAHRLRKFVLRAKVKLDVASSDLAMFGATGPQAQAELTRMLGVSPASNFGVMHVGAWSVITLPGNRYLVACPTGQASATWLKLTAHMRAAGWNAWQLQSIRAGIATVTAATREAFIPQMLALETRGGVSFTKGCYPGQEIVARIRYLGDLKRYLYRGQCSRPLAAGDALVNDATETSVGVVTDAAENAVGNWEFLAVIQREEVNSSALLRCSDGTAVTALTRADTANGGQP